MFLGVDVGGTNTDAVLMDGRRLIGAAKAPTTGDVTAGIANSISELLAQTGRRDAVAAVVVGTTHFTNALLERANLTPTAVLRLALPATELLPPLVEWPDDLKAAIGGQAYLVGGGNEFDGREISALDRRAIRAAIQDMRVRGNPRRGGMRRFPRPPRRPTKDAAAAIIRDAAPDLRGVPVP